MDSGSAMDKVNVPVQRFGVLIRDSQWDSSTSSGLVRIGPHEPTKSPFGPTPSRDINAGTDAVDKGRTRRDKSHNNPCSPQTQPGLYIVSNPSIPVKPYGVCAKCWIFESASNVDKWLLSPLAASTLPSTSQPDIFSTFHRALELRLVCMVQGSIHYRRHNRQLLRKFHHLLWGNKSVLLIYDRDDIILRVDNHIAAVKVSVKSGNGLSRKCKSFACSFSLAGRELTDLRVPLTKCGEALLFINFL